MARIICCIAVMVIVCIVGYRVILRLLWKARNVKNHGKGRVVKRKKKGKVVFIAQLYRDDVGWEDIPGLAYNTLSDAMTAMDKALERAYEDDQVDENEEKVMVERSYRQRK